MSSQPPRAWRGRGRGCSPGGRWRSTPCWPSTTAAPPGRRCCAVHRTTVVRFYSPPIFAQCFKMKFIGLGFQAGQLGEQLLQDIRPCPLPAGHDRHSRLGSRHPGGHSSSISNYTDHSQAYCASLAHKTNHSFVPICQFQVE